jgi:hypothetical protein
MPKAYPWHSVMNRITTTTLNADLEAKFQRIIGSLAPAGNRSAKTVRN